MAGEQGHTSGVGPESGTGYPRAEMARSTIVRCGPLRRRESVSLPGLSCGQSPIQQRGKKSYGLVSPRPDQ